MCVYCSICGKRATSSCGLWYVCPNCKPYQKAVYALAETYQGTVPEAALKALSASLNQYDTRTGTSVSDTKAAPIRTALAYSLRSGFGGAFRLPSMLHVDASSLYRSLVTMLLESGLLPGPLVDEVRAYLAELEQRKERLSQIVTYQSGRLWYACMLDSDPEQEVAVSGESESEALQKLYAQHSELGSLTA